MKTNRLKMFFGIALVIIMVIAIAGCTPASSVPTQSAATAKPQPTATPEPAPTPVVVPGVEGLNSLIIDEADKGKYPDTFSDFEWYIWNFDIDPELDGFGAADGIGTLYVRLYTPKTEPGKTYPLLANLGGLGNNQNMSMSNNFYASTSSNFITDEFQAKYPSYILCFTVPYEACVNYDAEMKYVYQFGEVIKAVNAMFGNVDMNRIYATGLSQGAGWSYEVAAAQPDLFAALLINCGTTVHTTWGNQIDMSKLMDVNLYILHGTQDQYIPINEAYRVYNTLKAMGKKNMEMQTFNDSHVLINSGIISFFGPPYTISKWMDWLFTQEKGVDCTGGAGPVMNDIGRGNYTGYRWAGVFALSGITGWDTVNPYVTWVEPADNTTWDQVKAQSKGVTEEATSTGEYKLGRFRIGDETTTTYDDTTTVDGVSTPPVLKAGTQLCMTVQGYSGTYGDDMAAFEEEWDVDWAVIEGDVVSVELTNAASPTPVARPSSVSLSNGGGPNFNNSLATDNALDGGQVYIKISLADSFTGDKLKVYVRFTRDLGNGEYASYYHAIELSVEG